MRPIFPHLYFVAEDKRRRLGLQPCDQGPQPRNVVLLLEVVLGQLGRVLGGSSIGFFWFSGQKYFIREVPSIGWTTLGRTNFRFKSRHMCILSKCHLGRVFELGPIHRPKKSY